MCLAVWSLAAALLFVSTAAEAKFISPSRGGAAPTMRAFDFYSKFGVNGNLDSGGTVTDELADMNYVGIKNIRSSSFGSSATDANNWLSYLSSLTAQGIRQHIFVQAATGGLPFNLMSDWITALKTYIVGPYGAGMVPSVSGPNESNIQYFAYNGLTGIAAANAVQQDLFAQMKADPMLIGITVGQWPVGLMYQSGTPATVGNITPSCDIQNLHDYYSSDNVHQIASPPFTGTMAQALQGVYLPNNRQVCDRQHFITTETGWLTPPTAGYDTNADEYTQARLLLNALFDHAMLPYCDAVYIFALRWGTIDYVDPGWGIMRDDGTPKVSGTAIHYLMGILNDAGPNAATFGPGTLAYSLSGMPAASGNFVIAKSNGSFDVLLWNETQIWDVATATRITIPTSTVTVTFSGLHSGFVYDPINSGPVPISTFTNQNSITVPLNDAALIVEVTP